MSRVRYNNSVALPATQTVIKQNEDGLLTIQKDFPLPEIRSDRLLVRVEYVAINPCDWKMSERFPAPGAVDGCDFAGTVVALGSDVSKTGRFQVGEKVCGGVHGSNPIDPTTGSFAEYLSADAEFTFKVPGYMGLKEAAAVGGTGIGTMGLALSKSLGLPGSPTRPVGETDSKYVLVYASSTSVGTLATQLLRLSGHRPIAVCSPKNYDLVKSYGAVKAFDYHSPTCAQDIRAYTKNRLAHIIDPIVEAKTMQLCYAAMGRAGGKYCALEAYADELCTRKVVKPELVMGMAILGRKVALNHGYGSEADAGKRAFGIEWYREMQDLLDAGRLMTHPVRVVPGRFDGIMKGLQMLKTKQVSGEKLIVQLGSNN
ncbi:trans-enoyl reductase phmE [Parastagonospora nodorum]|uniref:Trans-enoyl reductase phmE n=1 Tax=Phaeosphaeria nodorum (strain SN15 / ATCC MYA-4574 / FGSC 10173) TaxID=321614 RepID=A0A7U2HU38_PHANO|nr:trans-enoyl reductase phmE [Parastagonospora nodorum]QRC90793.1 trans-enoyl reductase phmE [Parastagonospora nodorum SN15]KAH3935199.1 trans-enoyl reductase phmE [Parastagonospora nodorum]KAH3943584.1 trans-enoyl reductase phmE [Parastagonospora nodorum]KAH3986818.1 trans-enoyl reductase phmE [Parastagonospora nodorum]